MREISISKILCEINPKVRKLFFDPKSQSPKVAKSLLLCRACQDESNNVKIVEI
jgi:hypothetical protein